MPYPTIEELIAQLEEKKRAIRAGGGPERVQKQHDAGKLTARERLAKLFDPDTFAELDMFVEHRCTSFEMDKTVAPGDGVVTGLGTSTAGWRMRSRKTSRSSAGRWARCTPRRSPSSRIWRCAWGRPWWHQRLGRGADPGRRGLALRLRRDLLPKHAGLRRHPPNLRPGGPSAGGAVYSPALTDFVFMAKGIGKMFITGPDVIKAAIGEEISAEALGGAMTTTTCPGTRTLPATRRMSFSPRSAICSRSSPRTTWRRAASARGRRPAAGGRGAGSPRTHRASKPYDMRDLIGQVVDQGEFLEVHRHFAQNIVVGFARLNGQSVGIVANQPRIMAGCLDINASDKAARFVRFCDAFNVPLITLVDVPGYLPGSAQEHGGVIRHGAKLLFAYSEATVPKITLIVRKSYGGAYLAMCSRHLGADVVLAWPQAEIAVMGPEGAANIIFRREIRDAVDPRRGVRR